MSTDSPPAIDVELPELWVRVDLNFTAEDLVAVAAELAPDGGDELALELLSAFPDGEDRPDPSSAIVAFLFTGFASEVHLGAVLTVRLESPDLEPPRPEPHDGLYLVPLGVAEVRVVLTPSGDPAWMSPALLLGVVDIWGDHARATIELVATDASLFEDPAAYLLTIAESITPANREQEVSLVD